MSSSEAKQEKRKICFFIAPIGDEESEERQWSDEVLEVIVAPAAEDFGYETIRADQIKSAAKTINTQVIQLCITAELVIADLSGYNPNVFYELAIRHAVGKPTIQMIQKGEKIPFDTVPVRTVFYDRRSPKRFLQCADEMRAFIHDIEQNPCQIENPITIAAGALTLATSENPLLQMTGEMMSALGGIRAQLAEMGQGTSRPTYYREDAPVYLYDPENVELSKNAATVLKTLQDNPNVSSLKQLAKAVDLHLYTVYKVTETLRRYGFVRIESQGSLKLAPEGKAFDTSPFL